MRAPRRALSLFLAAAVYIDPNAGSLVLQVLGAAAFSAIAFVGRVRQGLRALLARLTSRTP